jgi:hypothetical protein
LLIVAFYTLKSHFIFGVQVGIVVVELQLFHVDRGYVQMTMATFGNAAHLRVAVPVELPMRGHNHKKEREFIGFVNRKGNDCVWQLELAEDIVDLRDFEFIKFLSEHL